MADIMKQISGMGVRGRMQAVQQLTQSGMLNPAAKLGKMKKGTGKRLTTEERNKLRKQRERELRRKKRDARRRDKGPVAERAQASYGQSKSRIGRRSLWSVESREPYPSITL